MNDEQLKEEFEKKYRGSDYMRYGVVQAAQMTGLFDGVWDWIQENFVSRKEASTHIGLLLALVRALENTIDQKYTKEDLAVMIDKEGIITLIRSKYIKD